MVVWVFSINRCTHWFLYSILQIKNSLKFTVKNHFWETSRNKILLVISISITKIVFRVTRNVSHVRISQCYETSNDCNSKTIRD